MFPIKEVVQIESLASILKSRAEKLPMVYLGMPLGSKHKAIEIWDGITEKLRNNWHYRSLNAYLSEEE